MAIDLNALGIHDPVAAEVGRALNSARHGGADLDGDADTLTADEFRNGALAFAKNQPEQAGRPDVAAAILRLELLLKKDGPIAIDINAFAKGSDTHDLARAANDARYGGTDLDGDTSTLTFAEWTNGLATLMGLNPGMLDDAGLSEAKERIDALFAALGTARSKHKNAPAPEQ